jgi:hypothetical protein
MSAVKGVALTHFPKKVVAAFSLDICYALPKRCVNPPVCSLTEMECARNHMVPCSNPLRLVLGPAKSMKAKRCGCVPCPSNVAVDVRGVPQCEG